MESVDSCFICTTTYQIITAINLTFSNGLESDLYVVPQFKNADLIAERIKERGLFRKVIFVDTSNIEKYKNSKSSLLLHIGIALNYLLINKLVPQFHEPGVIYRRIYVSSKANIGRLMRLYYIKNKHEFQTIYFDDGESSYDNENILKPGKIDAILQRLLFGSKAVDDDISLLLYSPELFKKLNPKTIINVAKLPPITNRQGLKDIYNRIFEYSDKDSIKEEVIILDILKNENLIDGEDEKLQLIYNAIMQRFGKDNVIIKKHPRDKNKSEFGIKLYKNYTTPFEIILLNMDLGNKKLVSVSSTAITAPKLMFNQEPIVFYLGEIIKTKQGQIAGAGYYQACKDIYDTPDRFYIPPNVIELNRYLDEL